MRDLLPNTDKLQHFFVGSIIAFVIGLLHLDYWLYLVIGFILSFGAEVYQKITKRGEFDFLDAIYTFLPFIL